jgi:hypothetical protein
MDQKQKTDLIKQSGFKCKKCNFYSPLSKALEVNSHFKIVLCSICNSFAPNSKNQFNQYILEKIDWRSLESFRKFNQQKQTLKTAMSSKAQKGNPVSRPAFGYKMQNKKLIPSENYDQVREIFEGFLNKKSLNQLSRAHNLSVNGIKKILKNFTYIGKVKFDNKILQGNHQPIISSELFNSVQNRFEFLRKK